MSDWPVFIFIVCLILFFSYVSYIAFSLAVEKEGFRKICAIIVLVMSLLCTSLLIYGLVSADPKVVVYVRKS